jgi:hypothetical protein
MTFVLEPAGRRTIANWATTPQLTWVSLAAATDSAMLVDRLGRRRAITAQDGAYHVLLEAVTATLADEPDRFLIGGSPMLVVEP